jgi:hypothetical protein
MQSPNLTGPAAPRHPGPFLVVVSHHEGPGANVPFGNWRTVELVKQHEAQGWYRDPFGVHQDRYFSAGHPTDLVRDAGQEAYDGPPDRAYDRDGLVSAEPETADRFDASDLRRADEAERSATARDLRRADSAEESATLYDGEAAKRAALDAFDQMMPPN